MRWLIGFGARVYMGQMCVVVSEELKAISAVDLQCCSAFWLAEIGQPSGVSVLITRRTHGFIWSFNWYFVPHNHIKKEKSAFDCNVTDLSSPSHKFCLQSLLFGSLTHPAPDTRSNWTRMKSSMEAMADWTTTPNSSLSHWDSTIGPTLWWYAHDTKPYANPSPLGICFSLLIVEKNVCTLHYIKYEQIKLKQL